MAELVPDVLEKILITLDMKDIIRCKSVCKFWHSFISSSRFVTTHRNHGYNNDRSNAEFGHRRIRMSTSGRSRVNGWYFRPSALIGSSNGLVCIYSSFVFGFFVANPSTREVKKLQRPQFDDFIVSSLCWGFGYDSSTDDYKVVLVYMNGRDQTCSLVLSLKLKVWKVLGKQKYTCEKQLGREAGTLCNGALHWYMVDQNNKSVIVSFDLSKEVFKEIPQPNDTRYTRSSQSLANIDECLCIYSPSMHNGYWHCLDTWIMKKYDVQESWVLLLNRRNNDIGHYLENLKDYIPHTSFCDNEFRKKVHWIDFKHPIFVQSLVSPHVYERKRNNEDPNSKKNAKVRSAVHASYIRSSLKFILCILVHMVVVETISLLCPKS